MGTLLMVMERCSMLLLLLPRGRAATATTADASRSVTSGRYRLWKRRTTGIVVVGRHVRIGRMRRGLSTRSVVRRHLLALRSIPGMLLLLLTVVTCPSMRMVMRMRIPLLVMVASRRPLMTGRWRSCHGWSNSVRTMSNSIIDCIASITASLVLVAVLRSLRLSEGGARVFSPRRLGPRRLRAVIIFRADDRWVLLVLSWGGTFWWHCRHRRRRRRRQLVLDGTSARLGTDRCDRWGFS